MFKVIKEEMVFGGRKLILETGKIARQANSVLVTYGDTVVLCTAVMSKNLKEDQDFFPLNVQYTEKFYASGKIPGGFFKREAKPSEKEVLISRSIDRVLRPMFHKALKNEVQISCMLLSYDKENDPEIVAMIGASAAVAISEIPTIGTIAGAKVAIIDGETILNPVQSNLLDQDKITLNLTVAGTKDSVLMVESEAKEISEERILEALFFGHQSCLPVIEMIEKLSSDNAKDKVLVPNDEMDKALLKKVKDFAHDKIDTAFGISDKIKRGEELSAINKDAVEKFVSSEEGITDKQIKKIISDLSYDILRHKVISTKKRIDGRGEKDVRNIEVELDVLPSVHGSALFTRGETQALVITTLGSPNDSQTLDDVTMTSASENFMLHYNFPSYAVGEVGASRGPGRREIGHGRLAHKSIKQMLDLGQDFPYTVRVVSEITESNGSSSMATVCGTSLSLMSAGVPLKRPVAGIAMGLIKEGKNTVILTDILGDEDHLGDMDFKVAGTEVGITSLQMDIKIDGVSEDIMTKALSHAKDARLHILEKMSSAITESRAEPSNNAPKIKQIQIPVQKIGEVVGKSGSNIRYVAENFASKIDIGDNGMVTVSSKNAEDMEKAIAYINELMVEVVRGGIYEGTVSKLMSFGVIVDLPAKRNGMIHISELADRRIDDISEVVKEGDKVIVKFVGFDDKRRIRLSIRNIDQKTGEEIQDESSSSNDSNNSSVPNDDDSNDSPDPYNRDSGNRIDADTGNSNDYNNDSPRRRSGGGDNKRFGGFGKRFGMGGGSKKIYSNDGTQPRRKKFFGNS